MILQASRGRSWTQGGAAPCLLALVLGCSGLARADLHFLAWDEEVAGRSLAVGLEDARPIEGLHIQRRSEPVPRPGTGLLAIRDLKADGEAPPLEVRIPDRVRRPLVILAASHESPMGLRAVVIEDSVERFPWGAFRIFNTTARQLKLVTRDQQIDLPPGWEPADFRLNGEHHESVVLTIEEKDDRHRVVYSTIWTAAPDTRRIVIILPSEDERTGVIQLRVVPEFLDANHASLNL